MAPEPGLIPGSTRFIDSDWPLVAAGIRRNRFMALYELLLRPSMLLWHAGVLAQTLSAPQPSGPSSSTAVSGAVDRVLLVGNGPLHGWGVLSHDLSAVGHLSRALTRLTGRRNAVDYVGDERMTTATSPEWLGERAAAGYDLAVVVLSMNDALRLTPLDRFRHHYGRLVERLLTDLDERAEVVLMTLPNVSRYALVRGWTAAVATRHARRLSEQVRRTAEDLIRPSVVDAPVEHFTAGRPHGSPEFYADWAEQAAVALAPLLDEVRAVKPASVPEAKERSALVEAAAASPDPALVKISQEAKERFGVAVAGVSLSDGDRIAVVAQTGGAPASMPKSLMYCASVYTADGPVVILDRALDDRYRDSELIDLLGTPFYTGLPLRGADGTVVGAFCVLDTETHGADFVPPEELALFAAQAEAELQRIESAAAALAG
jgi:hypothetical protein